MLSKERDDQQNWQLLISPKEEAIVWRERRRFMLTAGLLLAFVLSLAIIVLNRWVTVQRQKMVTVIPLQVQSRPTPFPNGRTKAEPQSQTLSLSVQDFLAALRDIERRRQTLFANYQLPTKGLDDYRAQVERLRECLRQLAPLLPECRALHQDYEQVLQIHLAVIDQVRQEIEGKWYHPEIVTLPEGARLQINTTLRIADGTLEALCRRYGIPKPFSIHQPENSDP